MLSVAFSIRLLTRYLFSFLDSFLLTTEEVDLQEVKATAKSKNMIIFFKILISFVLNRQQLVLLSFDLLQLLQVFVLKHHNFEEVWRDIQDLKVFVILL